MSYGDSYPFWRTRISFEDFCKVIKGDLECICFVEHFIDEVVIKHVCETYLGIKWIPLFPNLGTKKADFMSRKRFKIIADESEKRALENYVNFIMAIGYAYVPDIAFFVHLSNFLSFNLPESEDTAPLSKGSRAWAEEKRGFLKSWEDFELFPWDMLEPLDLEEYYSFMEKLLPEGTKLIVTGTLFEPLLEKIFGYEGFFLSIYDEPELVKAVIEKLGVVNMKFYQKALQYDCVGGVLHADDLGFKTGTFVSPEWIKNSILPWFAKYSCLAHEQGKFFFIHSCGNVFGLMEDLIDRVRIDGFHSFQDEILPVIEFKKRYGQRVAILGGIDVDFLTRATPEEVRSYTRGVLEACMPGGKFCLGSGNSWANFIPLENYFAMLVEALIYEG